MSTRIKKNKRHILILSLQVNTFMIKFVGIYKEIINKFETAILYFKRVFVLLTSNRR